MGKSNLIEQLKVFYDSCKDLQKQIMEINTIQIANKELRNKIEQLSLVWFKEYSKGLIPFGVDKGVLEKYDIAFKRLLQLTGNNNRRSSYVAQFDIICKSFRDEIIISIQIVPEDITNQGFDNQVAQMLAKVSDKEENEYLREALGCWSNNFLKAAVVLVWCAAMDRIHKAIELRGFSEFNKTSEMMKAQTTGRFKKFNKNQNVQSMSDLRMVFDSDILWILEGMEMIDSNQRKRLSSCFDMRCHSSHPGEAPITKYNVLSCFSDIIEIILANPTFSLSEKDRRE